MAAVLYAAMASAAAANGDVGKDALECRMRIAPRVQAGAAVLLRFAVISHAHRPLHVLTWNTPLEGGWFGRYLRVTTGDRDVDYRGPQVKRGRPDADDYRVLHPGRTLAATVDLTQVYALAAPGRYRVVFDGWLHDVASRPPRSDATRRPFTLACPAAEFEVIAAAAPAR